MDTREHILMTAIKLLNANGFANVSMNDIVRETGISKGGVYWHFKSKAEIIEAVFDYFLEAQLQVVNAALSDEGSASDRLRRIFQGGSEQLGQDLPQPLEFYTLALRDASLMQRMVTYYEAYRKRITELIQQGIDQGEFAPIDADTAATSIVSFMEGIVILGTSVLADKDFATQFNNAIELMLHGLLTRAQTGENR